MRWLLASVIVWTGCSYEVSFQDCEVSCQTSSVCPDDFTCVAGQCRSAGSTGACSPAGTVTLRETSDDKVERSLVFGCTNNDGTTPDTSWYRVFSLADANITTSFDVSAVSVGVCFAVGTPDLTVKLGTYGGSPNDTALDLAKITPLKTASVSVAATQISKVVQVPIVGTIDAGKNIIVEVSTPDLLGTGEQINIGVTAGTETKPGFLRSPLCGTANPVTTTSAGVPEAHLVITVTGSK